MGRSSISEPLSYTRLNLIRQVLVGTRKSTKENAIYSAEEDRRGELYIPNKDGSKGKTISTGAPQTEAPAPLFGERQHIIFYLGSSSHTGASKQAVPIKF
jgi:hypothetical protein